MSASATARVIKGADLLDARQPGWHRSIDLDRLSVISGTHCVLGQLFGSYAEGLRVLNIFGQEYGFDLADDEEDGTFGELNDAWFDEATSRLDREDEDA